MASRPKKSQNFNTNYRFRRVSDYVHRDLSVYDPRNENYARRFDRRRSLNTISRILTVSVLLPRSVASKARREVYPYPIPVQKKLHSRVIRQVLKKRPGLVKTRVRIRVPRILPMAYPSYVSISRGRLNIHSEKQRRRLFARGEKNRLRYRERKTWKRKARHGQLDSPGSLGFGSVAAAVNRGWSVDRVADAALAARAIWNGGR